MSSILVIAPYVPHPKTHGGSIRSRVLLDALVGPYDVHLAVPVADDGDRARAKALAAVLPLRVHEVAVPREAKPEFGRKVLAWARGRSELLARRWGEAAPAAVAALRGSLRPDLVVVDSTYALPVAPAGVPMVLHLHNLESAVFARAEPQRRAFADRVSRQFEARTIAAAERDAIARAVLSITVSEVDRDLAMAMAPGADVVCVPNSVDLGQLPLLPPPPPGPPRVLLVGTLDYPPNFEALTELVEQHLPALRAAFPGLVLRVVGRDDAGRLQAFRGREGVEAIGPVDDLRPHYEQSHACYLPIRSGGGTRIKILEAWALGRPVLSTAVGAEGLGGVDGRHWRRFESVPQGVQALREVLGGQAASLVANARAFDTER